jgi:hypothetical protein
LPEAQDQGTANNRASVMTMAHNFAFCIFPPFWDYPGF